MTYYLSGVFPDINFSFSDVIFSSVNVMISEPINRIISFSECLAGALVKSVPESSGYVSWVSSNYK